MQIRFNVTGTGRKRLVQALAEKTGVAARYKGPPSFGYEIGPFAVDRTGTVSVADDLDSTGLSEILEHLKECGFDAQEGQSDDTYGLCIELPRDQISDTALKNIQNLIGANEQIIKNALGSESLEIEVTDGLLRFPWFAKITDPAQIKAYTHFVIALCDLAKGLRRVNKVEKTVENEKYAFRCLLLRLGFIGPKYKMERKILLKNLSGSSAFRTTTKGGEHQ